MLIFYLENMPEDQQKIKITKYERVYSRGKKLSGILRLNLWMAFYSNIALGPGSMGSGPSGPTWGRFHIKKSRAEKL